MKKTFKSLSFIILLLLTLCIGALGNVHAEATVTSTGTYEFLSNEETNELANGVVQRRDFGKTSSTIGTDIGQELHQQVNLLEVPSDISTKVVVWGKQSSSGWVRTTVTKFAEDFELNNPGWVVLAGVNADFFDINGNGDLPYQTIGAMVADGEVVRSVAGNMPIGFTNDGTANSLIGGKTFQTTGFKLAIYDNAGNVTATYDVAKTNAEPGVNEISVYFATQTKEGTVWEVHKQQLPDTAAKEFIVERAIKALPINANNFYGKGEISLLDTDTELAMGQFAIASNNEEANQLLTSGVTIRVQRDVTGDYANADNITGVNYQMLTAGEEHVILDDGNATARHPRTMVGKKADGSVMLFTVDGRQAALGMNGVKSGEMAALMKYYGCVDGYNLDGGGSTTMVIRDGTGFRVMNSPSDGGQRNDSNAILVVAPLLKLTVNQVTDTTAIFTYPTNLKGVAIDDVDVTVNGLTKTMADNQVIFDNLTKNSSYDVEYTYKLTRNGITKEMTGERISITTGQQVPTLTGFKVQEYEDYYEVTFKITDPDETITTASFKYNNGLIFLEVNGTSFKLPKSKVTDPTDFTIKINYNIKSSVPESSILTQTVGYTPIPEAPKRGCFSGTRLFADFLGLSVIAISAVIFLKAKDE